MKLSDFFAVVTCIFVFLMMMCVATFGLNSGIAVDIVLLLVSTLFFGYVAFFATVVHIIPQMQLKAKTEGVKKMWHLINQTYNIYPKRSRG